MTLSHSAVKKPWEPSARKAFSSHLSSFHLGSAKHKHFFPFATSPFQRPTEIPPRHQSQLIQPKQVSDPSTSSLVPQPSLPRAALRGDNLCWCLNISKSLESNRIRYNYFGIVRANVVPVPCEGLPSQRKTLSCGGSDKNSQSWLQVPNTTLSLRQS